MQLSVPEIARRLNVSRSPVREAVLQLVASGLASEQPRKGVVVATIELSDLVEIHEIREYTEALTARLAAERATATDIERLSQIVAVQATAVKNANAESYFRTNADFHEQLGIASGNRRLLNIRQLLEGQMKIGLLRVSQDIHQRSRGLAEHEAILQAIRSRDSALAERLMREHIATTRSNLIALAEGHGSQR
jgi:DNA-binding GntR family transcriptional regulator